MLRDQLRKNRHTVRELTPRRLAIKPMPSPCVHRVSYPSTLLQYISDIFLTLLIAAGGIALLMLGILLFSS
jgi:hypothetical protein